MNKKIIEGFPYVKHKVTEVNNIEKFSLDYFNHINTRRSVRHFSNKPIAKNVIENILLSASTAPSGAHKQPWTFCVISNAEIKSKIRQAAEAEEKLSYEQRMSDAWKKDLAALGTNWEKPFLEIAPYIIVVFKRSYELNEQKNKLKNYYVTESCGLACGMMLDAIHQLGLVSLTHTPSPMNFLKDILKRPENEMPFLLIPIGYPADECWVPDIERKTIEKISVWYE